MEMEEFSFPTIAPKEPQNDPFFVPATSLWFFSSPQTATHFQRSFYSADGVILSPNNLTKKEKFAPGSPALSDYGTIDSKLCIFDDGFDEEERMDCLWEQFHSLEAFISSNFDCDKKISRRRSIAVVLGLDSIVRNEKVPRILTLKRMHAGQGKKPNLVEMLGVLKKWFVAHGNSKRKH